MGDMTEPAATITSLALCPTCRADVNDLRGETPYNPDIEPLAKQKLAAPTGFMEWFAVPCGHPVLWTLQNDGRVALAPKRPE